MVVSAPLLMLAVGVTGLFLNSLTKPMIVLDADEPLTNAVAEGNGGLVSALLARGADVNVRALDGKTPLTIAVVNGDARMVKLLLARGADVRLKDRDGRTALDWARRNRSGGIADLLQRGER